MDCSYFLPRMIKTTGFSRAAVFLVILSAVLLRLAYFKTNDINGYNATTWDALGYYMYQPGLIIYDDVKELRWLPDIDSLYHVTGGKLYQANRGENGNYVFKYLGGVSLMQLPFFGLGHLSAGWTGYPQDGFSLPYQYAILLGALVWFAIGIWFLRSVLLRYFTDTTTAVTLLLLFLATNLPQYISIDGAMSHSWIFPLYCFVLWMTARWHERPSWRLAFLIGLVCGLAVISRPTEIIILLIPFLWGLQNKLTSATKWALVRQHLPQVYAALIGGFVGILPQLLYWKSVTGSWVYDVGSKWFFLNPWFRVLFGFYSGWFIYTPLTILFIAGFRYMKDRPFRKSVITFCLLNIWIIIAWSDWKYGVSYAGRALSQGSPVYAFALASFLQAHWLGFRKYLLLILGGVLILVNYYQIRIYNRGVYSNFSVIEKGVNLVRGR